MTEEGDYVRTEGQVYKQQWKALSAWFIGPRAENRDVFLKLFSDLFDKHAETRQAYFPQDPPYITNDMRSSTEFAAEVDDMTTRLMEISNELCDSVPFFSPRYQAHMLWDTTMPSLLGYMIAMLHGQNNVDSAASSVTTPYEKAVGLQLCDMLGYNIHDSKEHPKSWGHITCGGSIANIEALWASRNIKYSAIAVQYAVINAPPNILSEGERIDAGNFNVKVLVKCAEEDCFEWQLKPLGECNQAELLNMDIDDYCDLTQKVAEAAGLTGLLGLKQSRLEKFGTWVEENSYTSLGAEQFTRKHNIKPGKYTCPANCHYSWPKGGTLLGLGADALIPITLDDDFRQDVEDMKTKLIDCAEKGTPVFSVTAVMGSTEESAVDPIKKIYLLRELMKKKYGLNFAILADGAWGGYFKTMIIGEPKRERAKHHTNFVPFIPLTEYVTEQYANIQLADTITIDPHKSGFCPYPAGALCYRNGSMRNFIAFMHPEVYHGDDDPTMGVYGIEGSKPGAAPTGVLASHQVIGLDVYGYGRILGQCTTTAKIFYCLWWTLARPDDPFVCVPLQKLPKKYAGPYNDSSGISLGEHIIRTKIVGKSMGEIYEDEEAMDLLRRCGPDTLINTFVINMKDENGCPNRDVEKANNLQKTLSDDLNVTVGVCAHRVPFIIMQSGLNKNHGKALSNYKQRIGLDQDDNNLNVMVNTTMNPWQWSESIKLVGDIFRCNILNALGKMKDKKKIHEFVVCSDIDGKQEVYAEYIPDFSIAEHQYHVIVKLHASVNDKIKQGWHIRSVYPIELHKILADKDGMDFSLHKKRGADHHGHIRLTVSDIPRYQHFDMSKHAEYPEKQMYFIYGNKKNTFMSHCMAKGPDYMQVLQLNAPPYGLSVDLMELGVEVTIPELEGKPKIIDDKIVDPLDNTSYTITYKGRQYADCTSTIFIEGSHSKVFFKELNIES